MKTERHSGHDNDTAAARGSVQVATAGLAPIEVPYILAVGIPCYIDGQGKRWLDGLWHKDLVEHLRYIKRLTLACPAVHGKAPAASVCLDEDARFADVEHVNWPLASGLISALAYTAVATARLWAAVGRAGIVHVGLADWPIPIGWPGTVLAKLRGRLLVVYVESAFWRVSDPSKATWRQRIRAAVTERLNRWCVNAADLAFFTQETYRQQLLDDPDGGHVLAASWIDEAIVLKRDVAEAAWEEKRKRERLSVLFAARMLEEKGVGVLIEAICLLRKRSAAIDVHAIGVGPMLEDLRQAAGKNEGGATLQVHEPVPYIPDFFEMLRKHDVVVMPSISDEQPRLVYDALSQAVPLVASRTAGITACLADGVVGRLIEPGSAEALAEALEWALANRGVLREMGLTGLGQANSYTHQEMHRRRWEIMDRMLSSRRQAVA